jgi:LAO/AO transport system kinase
VSASGDSDGRNELVRRFEAGDRRALARLITLVENRSEDVPSVMRAIYARGGRASIIGITGPPGAGKSTLGDRLIAHYRAAGLKVGVVAVDPSSPFSGGAILGDRVRMQAHFLDEGVFIRSLSTRGRHGGLARATREVVRLYDAFGFDRILVETVGVGQTELDVMRLAHTTVVVLVPEAGDTIQVMKAGLLEIADIFAVNKADREGAARLKNELDVMLELRPGVGWKVPVLLTEAHAAKGIEELAARIEEHLATAARSPDDDGAAARVAEWTEIVRDELDVRLNRALGSDAFAEVVADLRSGRTDPYSAAVAVLGDGARVAALLGGRREGSE